MDNETKRELAEDLSREEAADLAEELMEHGGIDRTYILEALISDLRGGEPQQGLKALRADRLERA